MFAWVAHVIADWRHPVRFRNGFRRNTWVCTTHRGWSIEFRPPAPVCVPRPAFLVLGPDHQLAEKPALDDAIAWVRGCIAAAPA